MKSACFPFKPSSASLQSSSRTKRKTTGKAEEEEVTYGMKV